MADVKRSISDSPMVVSLWKDVPAGAKRAQAGAFEGAASQQGRVATEQVHRRYFQHAITTSYHQWVWEREAHTNWSMVTCQGSTTRSELTTLRFTGSTPADSRQ